MWHVLEIAKHGYWRTSKEGSAAARESWKSAHVVAQTLRKRIFLNVEWFATSASIALAARAFSPAFFLLLRFVPASSFCKGGVALPYHDLVAASAKESAWRQAGGLVPWIPSFVGPVDVHQSLSSSLKVFKG